MKDINLAAAAELLLQGKVGVIPTDTVYGLAARADDPSAVSRLYELKNREQKPGTLIASSTEQLAVLGIDPELISQVEHLWPNPVSIILDASSRIGYLHQDLGSIAARVTGNSELSELLRQTGPLITSSANSPGSPVSNLIDEAKNYFKSGVDFFVDGGDLSGRLPSTIISFRNGEFQVVREGALAVEKITV